MPNILSGPVELFELYSPTFSVHLDGLNNKKLFLFPIQFLLSSIPFLLLSPPLLLLLFSIQLRRTKERNIKNCAIKKDVGRVEMEYFGLNPSGAALFGRLMSIQLHKILSSCVGLKVLNGPFNLSAFDLLRNLNFRIVRSHKMFETRAAENSSSHPCHDFLPFVLLLASN